MLCNINTNITNNIDINPYYNILEQITNKHELVPCLHFLFDSMRYYVLQSYFSFFKYNFNNLIYNFENNLTYSHKLNIQRIETTIAFNGEYNINNHITTKHTWNNYNIYI